MIACDTVQNFGLGRGERAQQQLDFLSDATKRGPLLIGPTAFQSSSASRKARDAGRGADKAIAASSARVLRPVGSVTFSFEIVQGFHVAGEAQPHDHRTVDFR